LLGRFQTLQTSLIIEPPGSGPSASDEQLLPRRSEVDSTSVPHIYVGLFRGAGLLGRAADGRTDGRGRGREWVGSRSLKNLFEAVEGGEDDVMTASHQAHGRQQLQNQSFCPEEQEGCI